MNLTLRSRDLPSLHADANAVSDGSQRTFYRLTRATLWLGVLAAVGGAVTIEGDVGSLRVDIAAVVSAAAFVGMIGITTYLQATHPERVWYQARALAESVKTLAWQYSVGGGEYAIGAPGNAEARFLDELRGILEPMKRLDMAASLPLQISQITTAMSTLRRAPLSDRCAVYLEDRIRDQHDWYRGKSRMNSRRAKRLIGISLAIQFGGVVVGGFIAFTTFDVDFLGIAAAAAAGVTAWQQARDHESLAEAYALTARDLTLVHTEAETTMSRSSFTDRTWAEFVDSAEQAVSREHTVWLARRGAVPQH